MRNFYLACKTIHELQIKSNAILVYYDLCSRANKEDTCWPSKKTISKACKISVSTVTRSLRELEQTGMITTVARYHNPNNRQTSNIYQIFDTPQQFTQQPEELNDLPIEDVTKQGMPCEVPTLENPAACTQEKLCDKEPRQTSLEASVSTCIDHTQSRTSNIVEAADKSVVIKENVLVIAPPNYYDLSSISLFLCFIRTLFDTLPRVSVTPQGTIPGMKVTYNLRKESIFSRVNYWYKDRREKKQCRIGLLPCKKRIRNL